MAFILSGAKLTLENLANIIGSKPVLEFSPEIQTKFKNNTSSLEEENTTIVRSYLEMQTAGFGPELSEAKVKLGLVIGLQALISTNKGNITSELLNRLLAFFNRDISPVILSQSTPTGQNAQLLLSMLGSGKVKYLDYELNAADIMDIFSWQPLQLNAAIVTQVMNTAIFLQAALAFNLIKIKAQKEWLNYLGKVSSQISEADPDLINGQIMHLEAAFKHIQEALENNINNTELQSDLTALLANLNAQLNELINSIAIFTAETFANLISTSEPPATSGFTQALLLTQTLQSQIYNSLANITENSSPEAINNLLTNKLESALQYTEQLMALSFWAVSQVGKVFNLASENLTLAAYYHSEFYVPKELVSTQLDYILRFIQTHSAPTLT